MGKPTFQERIGQVAPQDVSLEKKDGTIRAGVRAYIVRDPDEILKLWRFVQAPIEVGDTIIRYTPAGSERLTVVDPGYQIQFNPEMPIGHPEHYAIRYQREAGARAEPSAPAVVYNLNGPNSRVNVQSQDFSINAAGVGSSALFMEMCQMALARIEPSTERDLILSAIDRMRVAFGTPAFLDTYQQFMQTGAKHLGEFAPCLPRLSQLLG